MRWGTQEQRQQKNQRAGCYHQQENPTKTRIGKEAGQGSAWTGRGCDFLPNGGGHSFYRVAAINRAADEAGSQAVLFLMLGLGNLNRLDMVTGIPRGRIAVHRAGIVGAAQVRAYFGFHDDDYTREEVSGVYPVLRCLYYTNSPEVLVG